jgi:hypothetical protein
MLRQARPMVETEAQDPGSVPLRTGMGSLAPILEPRPVSGVPKVHPKLVGPGSWPETDGGQNAMGAIRKVATGLERSRSKKDLTPASFS